MRQNRDASRWLQIGELMKLTRRAKTLVSLIIATVMSVIVASPALAAGEGAPEPARGPVDVLSILVIGVILLVIVIVLATVLSNMLGKRG